ncbi:MAG: type II toxin-antitoxin system prevent-host-death family antitoxin [Spirochaetaceae bacterium]|nr:type II toxin-antitoxin system prevent-host-death family antitoxin [Spirochaetaceae bacterium]
MKVTVSSTWAARNLGDCLARIRHTGDQFVLVKNGKPVAELVPVAGSRRATLRQVWDALGSVRPDQDFADDLRRVNEADRILDNPWD